MRITLEPGIHHILAEQHNQESLSGLFTLLYPSDLGNKQKNPVSWALKVTLPHISTKPEYQHTHLV